MEKELVYLTKQDIMSKYNISQSTLQRLMRDGLPFVRLKSHVVFESEAVRLFMKNDNRDGLAIKLKKKRRA